MVLIMTMTQLRQLARSEECGIGNALVQASFFFSSSFFVFPFLFFFFFSYIYSSCLEGPAANRTSCDEMGPVRIACFGLPSGCEFRESQPQSRGFTLLSVAS